MIKLCYVVDTQTKQLKHLMFRSNSLAYIFEIVLLFRGHPVF